MRYLPRSITFLLRQKIIQIALFLFCILPASHVFAQTMTVTAQLQGSSVVLNWTAVPNTIYYLIERSGRTIANTTNTVMTYTDTALELGQSYTYKVHAVVASGSSSNQSASIVVQVGAFNYGTQAPAEFKYTLSSLNIPSLAGLEPVAITQGSSSVSNGALGYKVVIEPTPGVNNHVPSLALSYNSNAANGIGGVGWNLSGLSAITRCAPTVATDGSGDNDPYTNNDDLCLDGQHLVPKGYVDNKTVSRSSYWVSGTTYVTELANFSEITSQGSHSFSGGSEPDSFVVKTKDGKKLYFGEANRSAKVHEADNTAFATKAWYLTRVQDRYDNEYNVYYDYDLTTGEHLPNRITYAPGAAIVFNYTTRLGQIPWGSRDYKTFRNPKILKSVDTYINVANPAYPQGGTPVRRYDIGYKLSTATERDLVDTIRECGWGGSQWNCTRPLTFNYESSGFTTGTAFRPTYTTGGYVNNIKQLVDMDGDGYNDAVFEGGSIAWGQADGQFTSASWSPTNTLKYVSPIRTASGMALVGMSVNEAAQTQYLVIIHSINRANQTKSEMKPYFFDSANIPSNTDSTDAGSFAFADVDCDGLDDMYYRSTWYTQAVNGVPWSWQIKKNYIGVKSMGTYLANIAGPCSGKRAVKTVVNYNSTQPGDYIGSYGVWVEEFRGNEPLTTELMGGSYQYTVNVANGYFRTLVDLNGDGIKELVANRKVATGQPLKWVYRVGHDDFDMGDETDLSGSSSASTQCFTAAYDFDKDGREDFLTDAGGSLAAFLARDTGGTTVRIGDTKLLNLGTFSSELLCHPAGDVYSHLSNMFKGDVNNDGRMDFSYNNYFYPVTQKKPDVLTSVTNGFGAETRVTYSTLTDDIYTSASTKPVFPYTVASREKLVVKTMANTNAKGGFNTQSYRYKGAAMHVQGRGFAGFEQIAVTDEDKGLVSETTYYQQWPNIGRVSQQLAMDTSGKLVSIQNNSYTAISGAMGGTIVYPSTQIQKSYGLLSYSLGSPISTKVVENQIDSCGNPEWQSQRVGGSYSNGVLSGELNRIDTAYVLDSSLNTTCTDDFTVQTFASYTAGSETRLVQTGFTKNAHNDIRTRTDYQGTALERVTTIYHTPKGVTSLVIANAKDIDGTALESRQTTFSNFVADAWPGTATNVLNQSIQFAYDQRFGAVSSESDTFTNNETRYDEFGRVASIKSKDNTLTENISFYCANNPVITCPASAVYGVATRVTNSGAVGYLGVPLSIVFYDVLQREIQSSLYGFDDNVSHKVIEYMANGNVSRVSEPFLTAGIQANATGSVWTSYSNYDAMGRAATITPAAGGSKTTSYAQNGYGVRISESTQVTSASTQTQLRTTYTNASGQVSRVVDDLGTGVDYTYDAQGNLKTTRVDNDTRTQVNLTHDIAGNKTTISDPDARDIQFEYNGFGELRRQAWQPSSAARKTLTFTYDRLGRKTQRVDAGPGLSGTYTWTYDQNNQPGMLTGRSGGGLVDRYQHDSYGRLVTSLHTVDGKTYNPAYQYDAFGRLTQSMSLDGFVAIREYSAQGYQVRTQGNRYQYTQVLWALGKQQDARGEFTHQLWGNGVVTRQTFEPTSGRVTNIRSGRLSNVSTLTNLSGDIQNLGYQYDSLGNLRYRESKRTDMNGTNLESLTETLTYDSLNRLDISTGTGTYRRNYDYDRLGNLAFREDMASSSTRPTNVNRDIGTLLYENVRNAGPHAVTSAGGKAYSYDLYGNMTQRGTETLTYDVFNKPTRIAGTTTSDFYYDADHQLYKQVVGGVTTIYLGNIEIIREGSTKIVNTYVDGVAQHRSVDNGVSGGADYYYLHRDNLGSVEAISYPSGYYNSRMSFDAWGNRQTESWGRGTPTTVSNLTKQGYTGHEQLDGHKLVHMQGRVYDPALGRFMSADLIVQSPHSTQSYNRYSYVGNNPLSQVDPTGYSMCTIAAGGYSYGLTRTGEKYDQQSWGGELSCSHDSGIEAFFDPMSNNIGGMSTTDITNQISKTFKDDGKYTITPIEGDALTGIAEAAIEDATFGLVFGDTSSISALHSDPQMTANKEAAKKQMPLTLAAIGLAGMVSNPQKGAAKAGIWSSTKIKTSVENAFSHWQKHKNEFPELKNAKQYVDEAKKLMQTPSEGTLTKVRTNGETLFYNPATNIFGVQNIDGVPKTMFRPDGGIEYWLRQN